jgi:hypothetical protein
MKKLEETGKSIATGLNPKNMASNMGSQLKTLLMVFGFARLAKEWPNLMTRVDEISKKVSEIKDNVFKFFDKNGGLSKMLGGKEGESAFTAFKNLFIDPKDGILAYIKNWLQNRFEERSAAVKNIPKPDTSWESLGGVGNNITRILGNVVQYLGNIFGAIMDPTKTAESTIKSTANTESTGYMKDKLAYNYNETLGKKENVLVTDPNSASGRSNIKTAAGDLSIVRGDYKGLKPGSISKDGKLTESPISAVSQGMEIGRAIKESKETGRLQTANIATGFTRLMDFAKEHKSVPLSEDFLIEILGGKDKLKELGLTKTSFFIVLGRIY